MKISRTVRTTRIVLALIAIVLACVTIATASFASTARNVRAHENTAKAKTPTIGLVYTETDQNAWQEIAFGAQRAASQAHVKYYSSAPSHLDGPAEVNLFQTMTRRAKDGIALQTLTPALFLRSLNDAARSGIPLVSLDAPPPTGSKVGLFIGNSNARLGKMLATALLKRVPVNATGEIVIGIDFAGVMPLEQRCKGMISVIKATRPNVKIVGPLETTSGVTTNYDAWNNIIKAHPHALAFMGPGDQDAVSLARIQQVTGKKLVAGAADLNPIALLGVKNGYLTALASPEHWLKGYLGIWLLAQHAKTGKPLPKGWWNSGSLLVTKANVNSIIAREKSNTKRAAWFKKIIAKQLAHPKAQLKPMKDAS